MGSLAGARGGGVVARGWTSTGEEHGQGHPVWCSGTILAFRFGSNGSDRDCQIRMVGVVGCRVAALGWLSAEREEAGARVAPNLVGMALLYIASGCLGVFSGHEMARFG